MTILVIGATGRVGRHVVDQLVQRDADVRVLTRDPSKAAFPASVEVVQGDLLDIDALRAAFSGISTLFLLNAVSTPSRAMNSPRRSLRLTWRAKLGSTGSSICLCSARTRPSTCPTSR